MSDDKKTPPATDDNNEDNKPGVKVTREFEKMRAAPASTAKEAFDAESFKKQNELREKNFKFWDSQPMLRFDDPDPSVEDSGPIEPNKDISEIKQEPYTLPALFEWCNVDIENDGQLDEVYDLLANHYVEDNDNIFRFAYPRAFLKWALLAPGWKSEFHIGVRLKKNNKLVALITAIPCHTRVYDKSFPSVEINFLCIHKKLRSHRLAPVLIQEVTRRVNLTGTFQAVYTAGVTLPKPVATCRYFHRSLNPKKLIETKFSSLGQRMTMARTIKLYRLPKTPKTKGLRKMQPKDVTAITTLLNSYLLKFSLAIHFSEEEVAHWFLPREGVISSYVVEDEDGDLTDLLSYYCLPSTVIGHKKYKEIKAAYGFYTIPNKHDVKQLLNDALILAASDGFDVFNCLNLLDYSTAFKDLKFGAGDGSLSYYVYNYKTFPMKASAVGLVLL